MMVPVFRDGIATMPKIYYVWVVEPAAVKVFLLALLTGFFFCASRLVRLAWLLRGHSKRPISAEDFLKGAADAELVAICALANRLPYGALSPREIKWPAAESKPSVLGVLRAADNRFRYLCEGSWAELRLVNSAVALMIVTSGIMSLWSGWSSAISTCEGSHSTLFYCSIQVIHQISTTLAFELSIAALLLAGSTIAAQILASRCASWNYFYSSVERGPT
jgi:hypothetical protein